MKSLPWSLWRSQILAIIRLEMKKTFFARRGLWMYVLAFAPIVLFAAHSIETLIGQDQRELDLAISAESAERLRRNIVAIEGGMKREAVIEKLGEPGSKTVETR